MDILKSFLIAGDTAEVTVISAKDLVDKAIVYHNLSQTAAAALGRTLVVTAFMSSKLKNSADKLSVTINGGGGLGRIVTAASGGAKVRGYVENPRFDLPLNAKGKLDVGGAVGADGYISVIKDLGLKEPYVGRSRLVNGEIAQDFAYYFTLSEQVPSAVAAGVLVGAQGCISAGGVIAQPLPNCPDETLTALEKIMPAFASVSGLLLEKTADEIIDEYFGKLGVHQMTAVTPVYECNCSRKRLESVVLSLGRRDALEIAEQDGRLELNCQFCNKKYAFSKDELEKLFADAGK